MSRIESLTSNIIINDNAIHTTRKEHSINTKRRKALCFIPNCRCECYDGDGSTRVTTPAPPLTASTYTMPSNYALARLFTPVP